MATGVDRLTNRHDDRESERRQLLISPRGLDDRDELVAPETGDQRPRSGRAREAARDLEQHLVAGLVAECVVDELQSVEVDDEHGEFFVARTSDPFDGI